MSDALINLETTAEGITTMALNRPEKHNAFNPPLIREITAYLEQLRDDGSTRVLIITGNGKSFSAGADLGYMKSMIEFSHAENVEDAYHLATMLQTLEQFPLPVIAAVNGHAIAGALGLVANSDIVIAAEDARFSVSEVRLGIAPAVISPYVVARMGSHHARRWFLGAERFGAGAAREAGLVHEIVPADQLRQSALEMARGLLENGPQAMQATKELLRQVAPISVDESMTGYTCALIARLRTSREGQQGLTAFFNRTPPPWHPESDS